MDIEHLSKSQLLLLTVLVNFVVSIATAVLTVSLLTTPTPYQDAATENSYSLHY